MSFLFDTEQEQETRKTERRSAPLGRTAGTGNDTEIALGTRSLLGIFFGLVLICAVFFGLGYSVGRAGGSRAAAQPSTDTDGFTGRQPCSQAVAGTSADAGRNVSCRCGSGDWVYRIDG
jgi:hypothetical protein